MLRTVLRMSLAPDTHGHDEVPHPDWLPPLDRRAALRLLGLTSVAAATGCGAGNLSGATTSASASTGTTASTTVLTMPSTTVTTGAAIPMTATVSPASATGTVTFMNGTTAIGSGTLASGVATASATFSTAGTESLTAVYAGSATYATSTSAAVSLTVTGLAACTETLEGEEGPYFVDDSASGYLRSNILSNLDGSSTQTGIPLTLTLYVFDAKNSCAPMQNVQIDIWHCNSSGVYSAESSESTVGQSWLRGYQLTDSNGKVTFTTILPGWYQGRTTHIHLRLRSTYDSTSNSGTNTTQLFFAQSVIDTLDTTVVPYSSEGKNPTTNASDRVYSQQEQGTNVLSLAGSTSAGYTATANLYLPI